MFFQAQKLKRKEAADAGSVHPYFQTADGSDVIESDGDGTVAEVSIAHDGDSVLEPVGFEAVAAVLDTKSCTCTDELSALRLEYVPCHYSMSTFCLFMHTGAVLRRLDAVKARLAAIEAKLA